MRLKGAKLLCNQTNSIKTDLQSVPVYTCCVFQIFRQPIVIEYNTCFVMIGIIFLGELCVTNFFQTYHYLILVPKFQNNFY